MNGIDISIIIPAKNGEGDIEKCLEGIFKQKTGMKYEVIVIDSGSCDRTVNIVREFPVQLIQIKPEEFGHGKTRNLGARYAKGKYLVYLTQDACPADELWLSSLIANFTDEKVAGAYSRWIPKADCNPLELRRIVESFAPIKEIRSLEGVSREDYYKYLKRYIHFSNVSSAISKNVWQKLPFNDGAIFAEDGDWAQKSLEAGYKIVYEPNSRVYHSHNNSLRTSFKRGLDGALFLRRTTGYRCNPIYHAGVFVFLTVKDIVFIAKSELSFPQIMKWSVYSLVSNGVKQLAVWIGYFRHDAM